MNQPVLPGPDLPTKYFRHCITKINEDIVALVGGYNTETTTLLVDVSHSGTMGISASEKRINKGGWKSKTDKNHRKTVKYGSIFEGEITKQLKKW